jgi:hypothetical protein
MTKLDEVQVARVLLEHGADVHARDEDGFISSQLGSREGHPETVEQ